MEIHYKVSGILLMILGCVHAIFPRYFNWKVELKSLNLMNRQMMEIHTLFIGIMVFMIGMLCYTSSEELVSTKLGKTISLGIGLFWAIRLIVQFVGYSPKLWKGKAFETTVHVLISIFWMYLSFVFLWTWSN